ncbi:MAG TPA: cellulase [Chitinophagaceae bacterium]|nr:cellulase [Chitinophagaceae bacterium]
MKSKILSGLLLFSCCAARAQSDPMPAAYLADSLPGLVRQCKNLLDHAYMAGKLLAVTDTLPGWEGFPVKLYAYSTGTDLYTRAPKQAKVYLLNPTPEKLAMWILTTCWIVKKSLDYRYTHQVFRTIKLQSGAQFPVKGLVYEDQYTANFYEPYVFKDGVTVYVRDSAWFPRDKTCTPAEIDYYLRLTNRALKPQTGQYARIISTTREDYKSAGGKRDVGDKGDRKIAWLSVVRDLYKQALRSDTNRLMVDWARLHLK